MGTPSTNMAGAIASVEKALAAKPKRRSTDLGRLKRAVVEPLREAYLAEVHALADKLAPRFIAHEFDDSCRDPNDNEDLFRTGLLRDVVIDLPLCTNQEAAHVVLFASPNAATGLRHASEDGTPFDDNMLLSFIAADCVVLDLLAVAFSRGWHDSLNSGRGE